MTEPVRTTLETAKLRRYSLAEIDAMRKHLYAIEAAHERHSIDSGLVYGDFNEMERAKTQRVEDQLRTYMLGGVGPDDLAEKVEKAKTAQQEWYAEQYRQREERLLRKEYGPR